MRKVLFFIHSMLLLTMVVGCSTVVDDENVENEVKEYVTLGDRVPVFTVETVAADGTVGSFSTTQLTGETVIVLFNTSCGDCRRELPLLNDYYLEHRNDDGFQMVAISREEDAESVAAYWKEQGLSIPYSAQTDRRIYHLFASSVIPRVYYCSSDGIITRIFIESAYVN